MLILDDVIEAGTSVRESVELIRAGGAAPCAVAIALDRRERGSGALSAAQEVQQTYDIPVISIATWMIWSATCRTRRNGTRVAIARAVSS